MILTPEQYPNLPKWPAAFMTGKQVTPEQAKNIIFRTDLTVVRPSEYGFGNDKQFANMCIDTFGWRPLIDADHASIKATKKSDAK
jgi:hypothetical protein